MKTTDTPHPGPASFATGANLDSRPDAVILTFTFNERDGSETPVGRIAIAPGAVESIYLELGQLLADRDQRGWTSK